MKFCKKCKSDKEDQEFYKNHDDCKKCWNLYCSKRRIEQIQKDPNYLLKRREYLIKWRQENPDKIKNYTKTSLEKNKEKIYARRKTPENRIKINELVKDWRKRNKDRHRENEKIRRKKENKKQLARSLIKKHLMRGKIIKPTMCDICKKEGKIEAHHTDYEKPLEIMWLCTVCHRHQHNKLMDVKE